MSQVTSKLRESIIDEREFENRILKSFHFFNKSPLGVPGWVGSPNCFVSLRVNPGLSGTKCFKKGFKITSEIHEKSFYIKKDLKREFKRLFHFF